MVKNQNIQNRTCGLTSLTISHIGWIETVEKDVASTVNLHKRNAYARNAICIYAAQRIKTVF